MPVQMGMKKFTVEVYSRYSFGDRNVEFCNVMEMIVANVFQKAEVSAGLMSTIDYLLLRRCD